MPIRFSTGGNDPNNHTSTRSQDEVERIVRDIRAYPELKHSNVGRAVRDDDAIEITKGIHNDRVGAHITLEVNFEAYHIYLTRYYHRKTFHWEPTLVCTGSQALQGDFTRLAYTRRRVIGRCH